MRDSKFVHRTCGDGADQQHWDMQGVIGEHPRCGTCCTSRVRVCLHVHCWGFKKLGGQRSASVSIESDVEIECTREVDKNLWPYQRMQWTVFRVGKSLVLGPREVMCIQTPFRLVNYGNEGFIRDCMVGRNVQVWTKIRSDGLLILMLENKSQQAVHVPPRTQAFLLYTPGRVFLYDEARQPLVMERVSGMHTVQPSQHLIQLKAFSIASPSADLTLEHLRREFPRVFDLRPEAMGITSQMQKMEVGIDDVEWVSPLGKAWSSEGVYQTISQMDKKAIDDFTDEQIRRGIVSPMAPTVKGFFSQSIFIPKKTGSPRWVVDFRRLNKLMRPWVRELPPTLVLAKSLPADWKVFTILDLENGFFNIPLSSALRFFFCVMVWTRRLVFNRLPQGWNCSAGLFHDIVCRVLEGIPGVVSYLDDIIIGAATAEDHDRICR